MYWKQEQEEYKYKCDKIPDYNHTLSKKRGEVLLINFLSGTWD